MHIWGLAVIGPFDGESDIKNTNIRKWMEIRLRHDPNQQTLKKI